MSSGAADEVPLDRHVQLEKDTDLRVGSSQNVLLAGLNKNGFPKAGRNGMGIPYGIPIPTIIST